MKIVNNNNEFILKENTGLLRFLGLFFFVISSVFVYGSLGGYSNYNEAETYVLIIHFVFGVVGMSVGTWLFSNRGSHVEISSQNQTVTLINRSLFGSKQTSFPFHDIEKFIVSEEKDSDGDATFKVDLELKSTGIIELTGVWCHYKPTCVEAVTTANLLLNKPLFATQNIS